MNGAFVVVTLLSASPSLARMTIDPPQELKIEAVREVSPFSATLYLQSQTELAEVRYYATDLARTSGQRSRQPKILASQITFSPARLEKVEPNVPYPIRVQAESITQSGSWEGKMVLVSGTERKDISLRLVAHNVPVLTVDKEDGVLVKLVRRDGAAYSRELNLMETVGGSPVNELSLTLTDLLTVDDSVKFDGDVRVTLENFDDRTLPGGATARTRMTFDLKHAASGSYEGRLLVSSENAARLVVPVRIHVKDPALLPAFTIVAGVVVALGITWYREKQLQIDRVLVRIQELEGHLDRDKEFEAYCGDQKIRGQIAVAQSTAEEGKFPEAHSALSEAELVWHNWKAFRKPLLEIIEAVSGLVRGVEGDPPFASRPLVVALREDMTKTLDYQIPDFVDKPGDLRAKLADVGTGWDALTRRARDVHELIGELSGRLRGGQYPALSKNLVALEKELDDVPRITHISDLKALKDALRLLKKQLDEQGVPVSRSAGDVFAMAPPKGLAPDLNGLTGWLLRLRPDHRIRLFVAGVTLLAVALLSYLGFHELYASNSTFGSDSLDYYKLLAWGFGVEAGRAQVATLVKGWGVLTPGT